MADILITRPLPDLVVAKARASLKVTVRDSNAPMTRAEMVTALGRYDAILPTLGDNFSAEVLGAAQPLRCRLLANFGVGYNHIDVTAASELGIAVTNTPGAVTDATADLAMTLILMATRRAGEGERLVRAGKWTGWHPTQLLGLHVTGKTVGIIGMGRIGQAIARRCHFGFGMEVAYFNRSPKQLAHPARQAGSMQELASVSDIVVAAVPGGGETRHLIGESLFAAMQSHAVFINIARGDVVDEAALITSLQQGQIGGAGLDVYEFEPHVPPALVAMENVALLPHMGTAALEVREAMGLMAVENMLAFFDDQDLVNPV